MENSKDLEVKEFFRQSIFTKDLNDELNYMRAKAELNKMSDYPMLRTLSQVIIQSIDRHQEQFEKVHLQLSNLDLDDSELPIDPDVKAHLMKNRVDVAKIALMNRENFGLLMNQVTMYDELMDHVHLLEKTPGGRKMLAQHISYGDSRSGIAADIQLLNQSLEQKLSALNVEHRYNADDFQKL